MKKVAADGDDIVVQMSRRELEALYGCVVEAHEALADDELRLRVGLGHDDYRSLIDDMRTTLGYRSIEDLRHDLAPQYGRDGRGPASDDD